MTLRGEDETQPFMVAFLKATNHVQPRQRRDVSRQTRNEFSSVIKRAANQGTAALSTFIFLITLLVGSNIESRSCRIQTLYISFKDLKWQVIKKPPNDHLIETKKYINNYYRTGL